MGPQAWMRNVPLLESGVSAAGTAADNVQKNNAGKYLKGIAWFMTRWK